MHDLTTATPRFVHRVKDLVDVLRVDRHSVSDDMDVAGFSVDTRTINPGEVYIAIPGGRVDGHDFVEEAFAKGASAALVEDESWCLKRRNCVLVPNTVRALGFLATCHRLSVNAKIVALTGSVGKTTTKEILYQFLSTRFMTRRTLGNYNSTIGLPIQLLKLAPEDEWMVVEMGMSTPGEIRVLAQMARPDVALWTCVHAVHQANFPDLDGIARAKAELVESLSSRGCLVYNQDDPLVVKYSQDFPGRKVNYGVLSPETQVQGWFRPLEGWDGVSLTVAVPAKPPTTLQIPLLGRFNGRNLLAATATAWAIGLDPLEFVGAQRMIKPVRRRADLHHFHWDIKVVDDTYNANPHAFSEVLRSFASLAPGTYRWLVCGDMLELGPSERHHHEQLGHAIARLNFDRVTCVGRLSRLVSDWVKRSQSQTVCEYFESVSDIPEDWNPTPPARSRVWLKASRGVHLDLVADRLLQACQVAAADRG